MIRNYFTTAWRNIFRNKTATLINLFGLSVSLVAFIFIALWVQNELSFDSYHKDAKDIYLVEVKERSGSEPNPLTPLPGADAIRKDHNAIHVARMGRWFGILNVDGQLFNEDNGIAVDSDWFRIFDYELINGDLAAFNSHPYSLIFTQSKARQLFGNSDPVGKIVKLDTTLYQVQAIVKDNPINSSLQFDMLVPMAARLAHRRGNYNDWDNYSYRTFVKVQPQTNISAFEKSTTLLSQQMANATDFSIALQPLNELHFDTRSFDPAFRRGNHIAIWVFSILAVLLLITASINYVNLTIAKANARSKEISIRKIIGGSRKQLFFQFLTESFLLCVISLLLSLVIIFLTSPAFDRLTDTQFHLTLTSPLLWRVLLGTLFTATLLSGVFPAWTMSFFKPLNYLHGYSILQFRNILVRKGLVVFQFIIGVVFIIGTIVIYEQMRLAQTSAAQYARTQVVSFELPDRFSASTQTLKNQLQKNSAVLGVTTTSTLIEGPMNTTGVTSWYWNELDTASKVSVVHISADPDAKDIFNFQMKEGRWFRNDRTDRKNYVLNETAIREFNIPEPAVGRLFARNGGDTGQIIGVIKDYNFNSLYSRIEPMVFLCNRNAEGQGIFSVKIAPGNIPQAMSAIAATWKQFIPEAPFDYQFMDQAFDNLYRDDLKISRLVLLFCCISITISALGLFGLGTFIAEQRTKEIGIRKVLGASVTQIAAMLSKDFVKLVMISIIIASPIAWWLLNSWLQNFAYKVDISWWIFLTAGAVALFIAIITVSGRAIRAAMANPVKSLRTQ